MQHYPTLYFYDDEKFDSERINKWNPVEYEGARKVEKLTDFLNDEPEVGYSAKQAEK